MTSSNDQYRLSLTVGPVQSFVAQARRTRDLWAGSWLLSYLSERALVACEAKGTAIIPYRSDEDRQRISSTDSAIGGIPNRFEVAFETKNEAEAAASRAAEAFRKAWLSIADKIWTKYIQPVEGHGQGTRDIWDRQTKNFWELSWVVTKTPGDSKQLAGLALSRRKHFRNSPVTREPGSKCSMMTELQELSGHSGRGNWDKQRQFWAEFRNGEHVSGLDLNDNEMLSAIGLIKRMFPEVVRDQMGQDVGGATESLDKLHQQARWPSLGFFAAIPWLVEVNDSDQAKTIATQLCDLALREDKDPTRIEIEQYWDSEAIPARDFQVDSWARVDATVWHVSGLAATSTRFTNSRQEDLLRLQRTLHDAVAKPPIPYYALLLADGDSMGRLLGKLNDPTELSERLGRFSKDVDAIIHPSVGNGRVVYAGGDDVFALLSAEAALDAAIKLNHAYREAFDGSGAERQATLSAAIVYAHWKYPLKRTIRTAHELLDDVAKDATGRNSLALGILQGDGLNSIWSAPWPMIEGGVPPDNFFKRLIDRFSVGVDSELPGDATELKDLKPFNSSYLYLLRRQFARLLPKSLELPGQYQSTVWDAEFNVLEQLAHAEFRRRLTKALSKQFPPQATKPYIGELMTLSQRWTHNANAEKAGESVQCDSQQFSFDGWRIARFLRAVKEGRLPDHD